MRGGLVLLETAEDTTTRRQDDPNRRQDGFTRNEVDLLGSNGFVQGQDARANV